MTKFFCDKCGKEISRLSGLNLRKRKFANWTLCNKCCRTLDTMVKYSAKVFFKTPAEYVGQLSLDEIKKDFIDELERINDERN